MTLKYEPSSEQLHIVLPHARHRPWTQRQRAPYKADSVPESHCAAIELTSKDAGSRGLKVLVRVDFLDGQADGGVRIPDHVCCMLLFLYFPVTCKAL